MIRNNDSKVMKTLKAAILLSVLLLFGAAPGFSQQVINLTAGPATTTLPDGTVLPMWGYTCGAAASTTVTATCAPLSSSGSSPNLAAATGALGGIYVLNGGSGYTSAPTVVVSAPTGINGMTATATAIVTNGAVVGFNLTNPGAGYTAAPTITIGGPGTGAVAAAGPAWSPVLITVPYTSSTLSASTTSLTINLTNNLSFAPITGGSPNNIPTSIQIVGQVGGGEGTSRTTTPSPSHADAQGCVSWFIAQSTPGTPCTTSTPLASPPVQGQRVQSMATEVAAVAPGTVSATSLTWASLKPGTYLIESATHPSIQVPMGLIGMLVVTTAPSGTTAGTAYPAVTGANGTIQTAALPAVQYNAEVPLEFSEIDPVQNKSVDQAVRTAGFNETAVWTMMNPAGVGALTLGSGGTGYTAPLSVAITGGGGSGATATATLGGFISAITVTSAGSNYTAPTVTISDTGSGIGTGATATATVVGGGITAINITNPGSNYTAPTVTISDTGSGTGTGATATPTATGTPGVVYLVSLSNGGAGYVSAPTVAITGGTGAGATATASVTIGGCGTAHTCYPPAVNYTPFYYLINGLAFSKNTPGASLFPATAGTTTTTNTTTGVTSTTPVTTGISGTILMRLVNAGLRMHVPSTVGTQTMGFTGSGASATVGGFTLVAEDGSPVPDLAINTTAGAKTAPRVQTDVFMSAGKVFDVMVNVPAAASTCATPPCATPAIPVYDRELSLSANSSVRDAGMIAYVSVNNTAGAGLPVATGSGVFATAAVNPDTYNAVPLCTTAPCVPMVVSDASKGVIANDVNVYGVALAASAPPAPVNGTLTCNAVPGNPVPGICANGTFTYTPNPTWTTSTTDSFGYCANGNPGLCTTVTLNPTSLTGTLTAVAQSYTSQMASYIKIAPPGLLFGNTDPNNLPLTVDLSSTSLVACTDPVTVLCGTVDQNGGFILAIPPATTTSTKSFTYNVTNSQGVKSTNGATVTVTFPAPSNLTVHVLDAQAYKNCNGDNTCIAGLLPFTDYKWIIEEDKTFWIDPNCTTNSSILTPGCPTVVSPSTPGQSTIPTFGVQFHTSNMDYVAQGCTGPLSCEAGQTMLDTNPASATYLQHVPAVCDLGAGACRPDATGNGYTPVDPGQVTLDPSKRYYISVLPGDAANPFPANLTAPVCNGLENLTVTNTGCGHTMTGAPIPPACNILGGPNACTSASAFTQTVNVLALPTPLPTGKLSVIVFEDDFPLNGEQDSGGGGATVAPIEPGLGGFNLVLWDTYGGLGDPTGQDTYDEFNQPLSNSLQGTVDPLTGLNACPVSENAPVATNTAVPSTNPPTGGITGTIVTCPKYEADGTTLSPLAGQAVIDHLMPEKFSVQAYPAADRIARGEQWVQTNTLDGQHPHDSFIRIGEPSYFQEYGPAGYHVAIGFANPAIINARYGNVCNGLGSAGAVGPCTNSIDGQVDVERLSRTPDQRLYASGSRDALTWTQCWVSLGDPDGEDFMFTFCDANGNFKFANVPGGNWRLTIGDQWNDQIIDGLSTPANVGCIPVAPATSCSGGVSALHMGNVGVQQWQANLYTKTCIDDNKNGICDPGEIGIPFIYTMIHYRDGHNANALTTDFNGVANFNETFPLFNWYVVEADSTRYKTTGIHSVYDAGGPADGSPSCGTSSNGSRPCGTSAAYNFIANTYEALPLPADLSVPGAVYCQAADCATEANADFVAGKALASSSTASTGRIDPPWVWAEGWSGMTSQGNYVEFGKAPYAACPPACVVTGSSTSPVTSTWGENGGIYGQVEYASTRPFDNADQMIQQPWEPNVPGVTVNLYQEGFAPDGITQTLTLVDSTITTSWDAWAQGFYPNSTAGGAGSLKPYMNCPGQGTAVPASPNQDLFFFTLFNQPTFLDWYNSEHNGGALHSFPYNDQYKCYDAMHIWDQVQPAPYDGKYFFPSSLGVDPTTGKQTTLKGGVGLPVWSAATTYAVGTVVIYNGTAYQALTVNTGVIPTTVGNTAWGAGTTPPATFHAATMPGTNCTVCVPNPTFATTANGLDAYDPYRSGNPMLPPGKYVVQVVMPPGYEVYKEEDKNLLIGDNFIAPVTQEFAGVGGDIFILPDQASVASMYDPTNGNVGYNPNNFQNQTTGTGTNDELSGVPGFPGYTDPVWPCVGEMRVVPDYLSIYPQVHETAPFAGATRPICDRKEVTLTNQMAVNARFFIYTSTHIAAKFTGVITDDFTSEFDPFAPQFGEKFSPPNMPVSTRDYLGNEISRVYSDHWGIYDGLTYSSWEVNPPNITGYSPTMMVQCMNDPGPILDTRSGSPTLGQMIVDPLYNSAYSDFCYENPFMPGLTTYNDTPVVPTQGFVGAAYNDPDCAYPDTTPAIAEVDGDGIGPYVSASQHTLTITALGNVQVNNSAYSGPSASVAPFNLKTFNRHYGFGTQCTATSATCTAVSTVTIGGIKAPISSWSDTAIQVTVPNGVSDCAIQQQAQYGGLTAQCGQLVITAGNGKQSIDAITVTIGGKPPVHVPASQTIQSYIDNAAPGDLIIVDPTCNAYTAATTTTPPTPAVVGASQTCSASALHAGTLAQPAPTQIASAGIHNEMLLMWKPVRLQGVGATSSIIDATAFPAGRLLDPWRRHVNCLFGLSLQGVPLGTVAATGGTPAPYDSNVPPQFNCPDSVSGDTWNYFVGNGLVPQVDRIPLEAVTGWDATVNGNLAEQLQEPSLMGAYEGAGITVLSKGIWLPSGVSPWTDGSEPGAFPLSALLLQNVKAQPTTVPAQYSWCTTDAMTGGVPGTGTELNPNPYPSNFECNPSSIDGLTIRDSSQGGGGIFVHGWAHNLQIANDRVYNNAGTLSGGITVGQGEFPTAITVSSVVNGVGQQAVLDAPPSCYDTTQPGVIANMHLPYCLDNNVNVHHNYITNNSSLGDELFSGTLAGGGGASFCTGADYYKFDYNWVCGNISSAEGGGIVHLGFIYNGDIEHNTIALNQSTNPTIPTNGGGIMVMGTPDTDPVCGTQIDADCPPGLSDGTGPGLKINANLIQANAADSGSGGGIRLQQVNGTEVSTFPGVYAITAATEAPTVTITVARGVVLPTVGDLVTVAGVTVAGSTANAYNGTFTVTQVGRGRTFQYVGTTSGLLNGTGGTFTDATVHTPAAGGNITSANDTAAGTVTITSGLSPTVGDTVTITGVTPGGYNGTYTVTGVPSAGTFTYTDPRGGLVAATAFGTVTDSNPNQTTEALWNSVSVTNNIIVNNVSGWDGAGISLQDSLNVNIVNNTIAHNDTLASSGVLTQSIGTPDASAPAGNGVQGPNCSVTFNGTTTSASCPQSSGLTSVPNSSVFTTTFTGLTITCPPGHFAGGTANNGTCIKVSYPAVYNDLFYQNRSFYVGVGNLGQGSLNQQKLISLFNAFTNSNAPVQASTGSCLGPAATYWDIGVRGDTSLTGHESGVTIATFNTMTTTNGNARSNNIFMSEYCNGSRVPPECSQADGCGGPSGYGVPPGIVDASAPNPVFSLTPAATVDEGNNWINVSWGPLALSNETIAGPDGNFGGGPALGNYALAPNSTAIDAFNLRGEVLPIGVTVPGTDFFGNPRPNPDGDGRGDYGAVETQAARTVVRPTLNAGTNNLACPAPPAPQPGICPSSGLIGTTVNVTLNGTHLTGASTINISGTGVTFSDLGVVSDSQVVAVFTIASTAARTTRTVSVTTPDGTTNNVNFAVTAPVPTLTSINPASGVRGTTVSVAISGSNLLGANAVAMNGGSITCTGVVVTGTAAATTVTANCAIGHNASLTARTVTVTVPGNGSGTLTNAFQVTGATLTISAPSPALCNNASGTLTCATGTANTTTKTGLVTVTNTATGTTGGPFAFSTPPTVAGTGFSLITGGTCGSTTVLNAGGSGNTCTVNVQYAPGGSTTTRTGTVTVTGTGLAPTGGGGGGTGSTNQTSTFRGN